MAHNSLVDYSTGFGGKYGVQKDRVDKVKLLQEFLECINCLVSLVAKKESWKLPVLEEIKYLSETAATCTWLPGNVHTTTTEGQWKFQRGPGWQKKK